MFSEPATGGTPDEQPGAMPEIFPSGSTATSGFTPNITRCWTCRSMVMQAWGNYGTVWPVIHQQLGRAPYLNDGALQVVPQVPAGQPSVAGSNIRLGRGSVGVFASHAKARYTTKVDATRTPVRRLVIGHTLPHGSKPAGVVARRSARQALRRARDQPRARGDGRRKAGAQHTLTVATR